MNGPYETSREAFDAARVLREAVAAADPGTGPMAEGVIAARTKARVQYVRGVLEVCGVQLGAYDKRMAEWVAGWDVETIQTITSWIERAHAASRDTPPEAEDDKPVISWVLYRPQTGSDILEPAGADGDVSFTLDPAELAVDKLVEHATGAWDRVVKVYGTRGQLAAWAQWEDGEAVAYRNGDAPAEYVHALPGIDLPGRLAGAHRGPRCGAQDGRTALFAADVTCPACISLLKAEGTL